MKRLLVVLLIAAAMPAMAQSDAEKCASISPQMQETYTQAKALMESLKSFMPDDLEQLAIKGDPTVVEQARASASGLIAGAPGEAIADFAAASADLYGPLSRYLDTTARSGTVFNECAAAK